MPTIRSVAAAMTALSAAMALANAAAADTTVSVAAAADGAAPAAFSLEPIVVTATRVPAASADLPMSIDLIGRQQIREGQLLVNLSEPLIAVPGVNAQNRQNYAQDLQISVRGFGARSSFGVRGVRLYADGIPGTMPDGQGQFSNFDLGSADRVEVLRGPFSALYGNSSGGVISIFTQDAPPGTRVDATAEYGSFDTQRYALEGMLGPPGALNLVADAYHFATDGYRDHSAAERSVFNAKAAWRLDDSSSLTLIANAIDLPNAQDPLGLTSAQLASDRQQAGTNAIAYHTRKSVQQEQLGAHYERTLGENDQLSAMLYGGGRDTTQYQAIPKASEGSPTNPGGIIALVHGYWGADVHLTDQRRVADTPLQITAGASYDDLDEGRRGYLNFIGNELGVVGALRKDETNTVYDLDEYLQLQWDPGQRWRLEAGVRNSVVDIASDDHLIEAGAPGKSGVRYGTVNPVAGLTYRAGSHLDLYGSYGKGFETPTLDELAYRSTDGSLPGLNFALKTARSDNYELGLKAGTARMRATLAGFYIHTEDELAVQSNAAGRSVYQNIPATQRRGAEAEFQSDWGHGFSSQLAYTYIQALTLQSYTTCIVVPCVPVVVSAGHRIPAVPADTLYAGVTWRRAPQDFWITLETIGRAQLYANDLNSQAASGYWLANLQTGIEQQRSLWHFTESLRLDNLGNRSYVGSVIVNETNSRYFEPEPGRTVYLMVTVSHR
ncbi:MAG TPA: TonB-dependent receptor [Steroidobacteraceae bacterium]|jgi:iron complex outermembrane receptor protein|nr:TonB-dependent receptor [Steroidobacteraceae bacterium]